MGTMRLYKCGKCGYSRELHLGIGMMYPSVSAAMKESIQAGEYGPELKAAYEGCELPAVRPEEMVYVCPACGFWDVYRDASVYEPADIEAAKKKQYGIKTAEEWGGIPYLMNYEIESGRYRLIGNYEPECPECGGRMAPSPVIAEEEPDAGAIKCPECGSTDATIAESGLWD